jgi:hypothetical protein
MPRDTPNMASRTFWQKLEFHKRAVSPPKEFPEPEIAMLSFSELLPSYLLRDLAQQEFCETRILLRNKLVSNSVNRSNKNGPGRVELNLLPQPGDAIVDSAVRGSLAFRKSRANQLLPRHYDFRPGNQESENSELTRRNHHRPAGPAEFHLPEIQRYFPELRYAIDSFGWKTGHVRIGFRIKLRST